MERRCHHSGRSFHSIFDTRKSFTFDFDGVPYMREPISAVNRWRGTTFESAAMSKGSVMVRVAVFASFFTILICKTQGKECAAGNISRSGNLGTLRCPRHQMDPSTFTECCFFNTSTPCCKPTEKAFFQISDTMAMAIAISVTSVCTAVTVAVIVCCFSSRCPLYTVCRVRYTRSEIASFTKSTDSTSMNNMPLEATEKTKLSFSPHIKNKNIGSAV